MSKPDYPQDFPYTLELSLGAYSWCGCGKSKKQPTVTAATMKFK